MASNGRPTTEPPRPAPLNAEDLTKRFSGHVYVTYVNSAYFIKSGVFAVASISAIQVLSATYLDVSELFVRGIFWFASLSLSLITVTTWTRGALLSNARSDWRDVFFPLTMGVCEYALFFVISPDVIRPHASGQTSYFWIWYLIVALHAAFAVFLVQTRIDNFDPETDLHRDLRPLGYEHLQIMKRDRKAAGICASVFFLIFLGCALYKQLREWAWLHVVMGLIVTAIGLSVSITASRQYESLILRIPQHK